ncbi:Fur family transcriptional regulator [Arthrobacter sp. MPF02]|uniref:Fur family transcriptional regulator n=1 Tax=Arthrobacter sp. MPF02 TaxID=3388492 RepID=UPI003984CD80
MLERTREFQSAQQLHAKLLAAGETLALATVYRLLQSMVTDGDVDALRSHDSETKYRRCQRQELHHHLVCRQCGHTIEIAGTTVQRWADKTARQHGYSAVTHTLELLGICGTCGRDGPLP